jgi:DNA-binding beta-propeller fold protein YncE
MAHEPFLAAIFVSRSAARSPKREEFERRYMSSIKENSVGKRLTRDVVVSLHSVFHWLAVGAACILSASALASDFKISSVSKGGVVTVTNAFANGIVTLETAPTVLGPWSPAKNAFSLGSRTEIEASLDSRVVFFRALAADLSGRATGSWDFVFDDILDLASLANKINWPPDNDGVSQYLINLYSPSTLDRAAVYAGGPDPALQQMIVDDLNQIIQGESLYDSNRFAGVHFSISTQRWIDQPPSRADQAAFNRLLLEDAYPLELRQKRRFAFTNLIDSYGLLGTIAGSGQSPCQSCNGWQSSFEGGPATNAVLSSPHIAMADRAANVYIADKRANAIRKVTPDGNIFTVAGNGGSGLGDTNPVPATSVALNNPNGLWVRPDGSFYFVDRDNGLIRKVDTEGMMTLAVDHGAPISGGRGLWVNPDETQVIYAAGWQLMNWDTTNGLSTLADGFSQLGNIAVDPQGHLAVTDANANRVYRLEADGTRTVIAGNGFSDGGGDGQLAIDTGLPLVRGIWFLPTGAFFLVTDDSSRVWYVDTDGHIHLFLDGDSSGAHTGDGAWFYNDPATPKISFMRAVTMDYDGNLLITGSNEGYVRKVQFLRLQP